MVLVHASVREDQDVHPVPVGSVHLHEEPVNGALQTGVFIIGDGHHLYFKALGLHILDLEQIRVGQDGIVHPKHIAVLWCLL